MKTYEQIRDILERIRKFHRRLRDKLEEVRPEAKDARTQFVLESTRRDEQAMNLALAQYRPKSRESPLETWVQYVPDDEIQRLLDEARFTEDMTPEKVLEQKIEIDRALVDLYRRLAGQMTIPRVVELFERLAEHTEQRLKDKVWETRSSDEVPKHNPGPDRN